MQKLRCRKQGAGNKVQEIEVQVTGSRNCGAGKRAVQELRGAGNGQGRN